jgi:hypothetical protein
MRMADCNDVEWRNFFTSLRDLRAAKRRGEPTGTYVLEIETIVAYTDNDRLRDKARRVLADVCRPEAAIA